jgi:hypothetical protein
MRAQGWQNCGRRLLSHWRRQSIYGHLMPNSGDGVGTGLQTWCLERTATKVVAKC